MTHRHRMKKAFCTLAIMRAILSSTLLVADAFTTWQQLAVKASLKSSRINSITLQAKKSGTKKKTNNSKSSTASGFGISATSKTKSSPTGTADDYAVFPALEPRVKETLVRAGGDMANDEPGELPGEIYARLDQIYGFENFNYEPKEDGGEQEEGLTPISFAEMLSGSAFEEDEDDNDGGNDSSKESLPISKLPAFDKFHVLHVDPLVLQIDDFFTPEECDAYVEMTKEGKTDIYKTESMTVGKDAKSQAQRTSTTWFNHYKNVPALMAKASRLLGLDNIDQWEEPQTVRCVLPK